MNPSVSQTVSSRHLDGRLHSISSEPLVLHTEFDVAAYTRNARGRIKVDKTAVELQDQTVREDLGFLWRLDSAALSEARALLATWTSNEARITAFVATWGYERLWLAYALRDLLTAGGEPLPEPLERGSLRGRVRRAYVERGLPMIAPVWTNIVGESVTAGQMARLFVQESAFQAAYEAMLPRLDGEARRVVAEIISRRDEIIRFFRLEAIGRISRSPQEARMVKVFLHRGWQPLRIVGAPDPDEPRAMASIFRTQADRQLLRAADTELRELLAVRPTGVFTGPQRPTAGLLARKRRYGIRP